MLVGEAYVVGHRAQSTLGNALLAIKYTRGMLNDKIHQNSLRDVCTDATCFYSTEQKKSRGKTDRLETVLNR